MFQTALQRGEYRLSPVVDFQPSKNHADVALHRGFGDAQRGSYLPVAFSMNHQGKHFAFPGTEVRVRRAVRQAARDRWREKTNSSLHPAQSVYE